MKRQTILAAALLCGAPFAWAAHRAPSPIGVAAVASADDYETLVAEFEAAQAEYEAKLLEADRAARRELRKKSPTILFWERFQALAEGGDGPATVWLIDNISSNRTIRSSDRGTVLEPLYRSLIADHATADWFGDVVASLGSNVKYLEEEPTLAMLGAVLETEANDEAKAGALYYSAGLVSDIEQRKAFIARIADEFPNTLYGTAALAMNADAADSQVGRVAPNFVGRTIDGHQFSLEDYRGKVVLLDFYGFW
ncbi:MAG: hypothetical protein AAGA20_15530 [Planctomycetota bacterium]